MKTIDIKTTQKVTIEYELAGLQDRGIATVIDLFIIGIVGGILSFMLMRAMEYSHSDFSRVRLWFPLFFFLSYHFLSELLLNGQSIGKLAMGIKVVKVNGKKATTSDYLIRAFFQLIDTFMSICILGSLMILSTDKRQRLGDLAANTTVIKTRFNQKFTLKDILRISSLNDYEPQYPFVRQFNEDDMLLIKSAISRYQRNNNKAHAKVIDTLTKDMMLRLDVITPPENNVEFLKTIIKDYIVLTR